MTFKPDVRSGIPPKAEELRLNRYSDSGIFSSERADLKLAETQESALIGAA